MDMILSSRVKSVDGKWYYTEYHVAYAQQTMDTSENFITREEADAAFDKRLADARKAWGHNGARFMEKDEASEHQPRRIRFRSIRKTGKPGTLTGVLYMTTIKLP